MRFNLAHIGVLITAAAAAQSAVPPLSQLESADWHRRSAVVESLARSPGARSGSDVRSALLAALDRENGVIRSTLRESDGKVGVSEKYGEAYSEYYSLLLGLVDVPANYEDPAALKILAGASYNPDSAFAATLATYADKFTPSLLADANSDVATIRSTTVQYIGTILHVFKPSGLGPSSAAQLMRVLNEKAGGDTDENVRFVASVALRNLADLNGDRRVDCSDLAIAQASLNKRSGDQGFDRRADIALRGAVDVTDLDYVTKFLPSGLRCNP
jgi:hypothetical protein